MTRPNLIDLNPNGHNQRLHHYPFITSLDKCDGGCNTTDDPPGRIYVPNKIEDVYLNIFKNDNRNK